MTNATSVVLPDMMATLGPKEDGTIRLMAIPDDEGILIELKESCITDSSAWPEEGQEERPVWIELDAPPVRPSPAAVLQNS